MYDIIVIGAGPAGMTAALNCLRAEKSVLVLESDTLGGQISYSPKVENFPTYKSASGAELMDKLYEQISDLGAEFELENVQNIKKTDKGFIITTDYNKHECITCIIATGVKHRPIGVDREEELLGNGISYCAICDGAFYADEEVVLIGDANTALQYTLLLSSTCKTVHLCTLFDKFFADKPLIRAVLSKPNIKIYHNLLLKEFLGKDELDGVIFENTVDKSISKFDTRGVFICIGQVPNNTAFSGIVDTDKEGYIIADENCITSCKGIFVAGDCRTKNVRQLVTATADGSVAAFYACQYIDCL